MEDRWALLTIAVVVALDVIFGCIRIDFLKKIFNSLPENWVGNYLYYSIRFSINEPEEV